MAKKIKTTLKLNLRGGAANPAPPVGPILGQAGVNIMDFCSKYNDLTKDRRGEMIPALVTVYEDRSFDIELRLAPVAAMIMAELKISKGSGEPNSKKVGTLSQEQLAKIAESKMSDLNANSVEAAKKMVVGTARSMGVVVEGVVETLPQAAKKAVVKNEDEVASDSDSASNDQENQEDQQ